MVDKRQQVIELIKEKRVELLMNEIEKNKEYLSKLSDEEKDNYYEKTMKEIDEKLNLFIDKVIDGEIK